jgi:hypothetical protein
MQENKRRGKVLFFLHSMQRLEEIHNKKSNNESPDQYQQIALLCV